MDEAELLKRLMVAFKEEAKEHTNTIATGLIELEKNPDDDKKSEIHEEIYRAAHSMKGASRAVSLTGIEKLFQSFEGCLSLMKDNELTPTPTIFDVFHSTIELAESLLKNNTQEPDEETIKYYVNLLDDIELGEEVNFKPKKNIAPTPEKEETVKEKKTPQKETKQPEKVISKKKEESPKPKQSVSQKKPPVAERNQADNKIIKNTQDSIRLSSKKIDEIYLLAEESLQLKLGHGQELREILTLNDEFKGLKDKCNQTYSSLKQLNSNLNEELVATNTSNSNLKEITAGVENMLEHIKSYEKKLSQLNRTSRTVSNFMHNILDNLVDEVKNILMLPFSNLTDSFPRIVRDLSKNMKKEIDLNISGATIEVDRRIMEELKDPLIHIIRNCIDHGIEKPEERTSLGKKSRGKIDISIIQADAKNVQIEIKDDGAGISLEKVKTKALKNGVVSESEIEKLTEKEIRNLIFKSGISTSSIITDISGRGLGLAIVEENVEKLGGKIQLHSEQQKGTKFTITVPTSVSKARGVLIKVNKKPYIFPGAGIVETLRVLKDDIKIIENKKIIPFRDKSLPLVYLSEVLQVPNEANKNTKHLEVVVLESLNQSIGFVVDSLEDEQEVLFKKTGYPLIKIRNISGVSLLGTGEICPVLNNQDLIKSALQATSSAALESESGKTEEKQKSIIMAEDSITSRLFLKNILESAGYKVKATIDGKEALSALKQEKFDLLVSDVEMPRMNGFELTQAVRNDKTLKDLPVVLVTSLSKREHKEKGIDAGANAYIVKSSFEQSNLLEVVKRLI